MPREQESLFDLEAGLAPASPLVASPGAGPAEPGAAAPGHGRANVPLAERLRPQSLEQVVGQRQLLSPGKPLRLAFDSGRLHSMILWGPPGVGKTTLARLLAQAGGQRPNFIVLSAVLAGVKDIREAVDAARIARGQGLATVVFVDEVHRFNKAQQDAFLPHVEAGLFTFIGATTENPSFEVNSALLSRASVHVLQALDDGEQGQLIDRAQALLGMPPLSAAARQRLVGHADGDARRLLNAYQNLADLVLREDPPPAEINEPLLEQALGQMLRRYDKGGDQFYDMVSALHKSVRGSNPDAALYWLARMVDGGVDARYISRRLIRMASEDIGLADPRALQLTLQAAEVYERLGSPEGELALAEATVYLAMAAKSNAVYAAWNAVRALVKQDSSRPVPIHLRNAPTRLMKDLGHGSGYRYAHDESDGYAAGENYLPEGLPQQRFYQPVPRGLELRLAERLDELRRRDALAGGAGPEEG